MSFRLDILKESVTWAENLDDTASKVAARLDDKAQQTGGMAGLFLAAAFGFLKPENFASMLGGSNRWPAALLIASIGFFLLSLAACLSVTWLRSAPMPLSLSGLTGFNDDLLRLPSEALTEAVQENYYRDRLAIWTRIIEARKSLNKDKALRLQIAQTLLALGMLAVSTLLFVVIRTILLSSGVH